jgi:hypothetical protein
MITFTRILSLCAVLVLVTPCAPRGLNREPSFDYGFVERMLASCADNHVEFQQLSDSPVVYRAWGVWKIAHPAKAVATVALDFGRYDQVFRYVYKCTPIKDPRTRFRRGQSTWYVEGRAAVARVWSIGIIDSVGWQDSSHLRFFASQTEDGYLESKWGHSLPGWLNYRTHGVRLAAFIVGAGKDSCRVGIVAQGWVWEPMPNWLVRLSTGIILPRLLADLDKEVSRRAREAVPTPTPWYKKWYRSVRRFMVF